MTLITNQHHYSQRGQLPFHYGEDVSIYADGLFHCDRNLGISRAPLKNQAHQGTSLFMSAVTKQKGCPKGSPWYFRGYLNLWLARSRQGIINVPAIQYPLKWAAFRAFQVLLYLRSNYTLPDDAGLVILDIII